MQTCKIEYNAPIVHFENTKFNLFNLFLFFFFEVHTNVSDNGSLFLSCYQIEQLLKRKRDKLILDSVSILLLEFGAFSKEGVAKDDRK